MASIKKTTCTTIPKTILRRANEPIQNKKETIQRSMQSQANEFISEKKSEREPHNRPHQSRQV
jgi:hypothetical protein